MSENSSKIPSLLVITILLLVPVLQSFPIDIPLLPEANAKKDPPITLNNVATNSGSTSSTITISNFNVGTGNNMLLLVGIESNNNAATSVKFGSTSLTQAISHFTNDDTEFWYLKNPSGTANVVATFAGSTYAIVGAYAFSGANQTSPIATTQTNSASSGNPTITLTTQYANSWVLDSPSIYGGSKLSSPSCSKQWNIQISSQITGASSSDTTTTPGSVTCSWSNSQSTNGWDDAAVEIRAATGNTAPGVPTNPTSAAVNTTALTLGWMAPSNNGGSPITGYQIQKASTSWVTVVNNTGNVTSYTIGSLGPNSVQTYHIGAWNSVGLGPFSSNDTGYTMPISPSGLTATAVSSSQINLSWTAPSGNGTIGYKIERSTDGGSTWSTIDSNTGNTNTSYSDTGLAASTTYTYRVSTVNGGGTSSPSNTASATTQAAPQGIELNNVGHTSGTVSSSPYQITLSNFNASVGSNRLLVVGIEANNANVAGIAFGVTPLTQAIGHFYNDDTEFWYLKNPGGASNIVVNMTGSTGVVVGAYAFSGVNQTDPIPTTATNNATSNHPTISLTTKYSNSWVLDSPSIFGSETLGSPTCTQQWDVNIPSTVTGASSNKTTSSPGSVTCTWTASASDGWDDAAIEIKSSTLPTVGDRTSTGIMGTFYNDPYSDPTTCSGAFQWANATDVAGNYTHMPFIAVINPNNGHMDSTLHGYVCGVQQLQAKGIRVLGYVDTNFTGCATTCGSNLNAAKGDIDQYKNYLGSLNGLFFDDMYSGDCTQKNYYQTLTTYAKNDDANFTYTVGNPGTETAPCYIPTVSNLVINETDNSIPTNSSLQGTNLGGGNSFTNWHTYYDKSHFSYIAKNLVSYPSQNPLPNDSIYTSYLYLVNKCPQYEFNCISDWISTQMGDLYSPSVLSTVQAKDKLGNLLNATVLISQAGHLARTGLTNDTSFAYNETSGLPFAFNAQSISGYTTCNWSDGSNTYSNPMSISPIQNKTYTVTYSSSTC